MNIKEKLKRRLLEIPINSRAYREVHRLADDISEDVEKIEFYLNELVNLDILTKKTQYICPNCNETTTMDDDFLSEIVDENGHFECDNCMDFVDSKKNITGYFYYDIKDKKLLEKW